MFDGQVPRLPADAPPQPVGHAIASQDFSKDQGREEALGRGEGAATFVGGSTWSISGVQKLFMCYLPKEHF